MPTKARSPKKIQAWQDDPGEPQRPHTLISRPRPSLDTTPLPVKITQPAPRDAADNPGTPEFRYWSAADALRRASDMWGSTIGTGAKWYQSVGKVLPVDLDRGVDLNAYYDREGLRFFHAQVDGHVLYSGESPDVVCHEHGHAVLDSLRPELFDAPFIEAAAFHEAFGDMSSILCALQLGSVRESLIKSTKGRIHRNSMVSRLAEQLGWAIRQDAPDAVDRDALRNAANTWFYQDPAKLPPSAPASQLCSEPHSFSRVFSGAFLYALSGMLSVQGKRRPTSAHLLQVTKDARRLLREAAAASPVVPGYFSQFAAHMVSVDSEAFGGRYRDALTGAFVRHGILSLPSATALTAGRGPKRLGISGGKAAASQPTMKRVAITGEAFGLPADVIVPTPSDTPRFRAAAATPDLGSIDHPAPERAAASFVEDLFRRGRIDLGQVRGKRAALANPVTYKSHELIREDDGLVLRRRLFDCGLHAE